MKNTITIFLLCLGGVLQAQKMNYTAYFQDFTVKPQAEEYCSDLPVDPEEDYYTIYFGVRDDVEAYEWLEDECSGTSGCTLGDLSSHTISRNERETEQLTFTSFLIQSYDESFTSDRTGCIMGGEVTFSLNNRGDGATYWGGGFLEDENMKAYCVFNSTYLTTSLEDAIDNTDEEIAERASIPGSWGYQKPTNISTGGDKPFWAPKGSWANIDEDCAASGSITHNEESKMVIEVEDAKSITFDLKTSAEGGDCLYVYVDGSWFNGLNFYKYCGERDWQTVTIELERCESHIIEWAYRKDDSDASDEDEDRVWVDNVVIEKANTSLNAPGYRPFALNSWNVLCYSLDEYKGYFVNPAINIDSEINYEIGEAPSEAYRFVGCDIPKYGNAIAFQKEGLEAGYYDILVKKHGDGFYIQLDGESVFSSPFANAERNEVVWTGYIEETTLLKLATTDLGSSQAFMNVEFNRVELLAGAITEQVFFYGETTSISSQESATGVGSIVYLWEESSDQENWSPADGVNNQETYQLPALPSSTFFRRKALDPTMQATAYSNITEVVVPVVWRQGAWDNGQVPDASKIVIVEADYTVAEFGSFSYDSLVIGSEATFSVDGLSTFEMTGDITLQGSMDIASGASLLVHDFDFTLEEDNQMTIRRNTSYADGRYSFVGSPVRQTSSAALGQFVYRYDETKDYAAGEGINRWIPLNGNLWSGYGYTQAFQQEIVFTGIPNSGRITALGTYTGTYDPDNYSTTQGWFLVANPYASAISIAAFLAHNDNLEPAIYLWDDNGQARGTNNDYIIANATTATQTTAGRRDRYNFHIGSAQGFFVKLASDTDREVEFTTDMQVGGYNSDDNFFRAITPDISRINLTNKEGLFRQTVLVWDEDKNHNAHAFNPEVDNLIAIMREDEAYAIAGISEQMEELPLVVNHQEAGRYTISLDATEAAHKVLYLYDLWEEKEVNLAQSDYEYSTEAGQSKNRFVLKTKTNVLTTEKDKVHQIYAYENTLYFRSLDAGVKRFQLFNLSGTNVRSLEIAGSNEVSLNGLPNGIYILKGDNHTQKIIIE
ncbi:MAG: T9SS type A sorting domain-containing protein [Cyclobacteriaceae bacterium]